MLRIEARNAETPIERKPSWIRTKARTGPEYTELNGLVKTGGLHTVCEEAGCPNIYECWEDSEATFLIGGSECTRRCDFCQIDTGKPDRLDRDEPRRVAERSRRWGCATPRSRASPATTSPTAGRGSTPRRSARSTRSTAAPAWRSSSPTSTAGPSCCQVFDARPEVFAHNVETVPRIFKRIRPAFRYDRSLDVITMGRDAGLVTKSNLILGMGEEEEVVQALRDLHEAGTDIITITQYLRPTPRHHPVDRWVKPEEFVALVRRGRAPRLQGRHGRPAGPFLLPRGPSVGDRDAALGPADPRAAGPPGRGGRLPRPPGGVVVARPGRDPRILSPMAKDPQAANPPTRRPRSPRARAGSPRSSRLRGRQGGRPADRVVDAARRPRRARRRGGRRILLGDATDLLAVLGVPLAFLAATIVLSRRAERAAYRQIEGQPGAVGAALKSIRRGWYIQEEPVAADAQRATDLSSAALVFRALGRPGIVLIAEGPAGRAQKLLAAERRKVERVAPGVPVTLLRISDGSGDDEVSIRKLASRVQRLKPVLTKDEVAVVNKRLRSIGGVRPPLPKGIDPTKARVDRKAMRGR